MSTHPLMQARMSGVRIPENQSTEQAPSMKLVNFMPGTWGLAEYGNERGQKETTVVFLCGNRVFVPNYPNYQQWTESFRPLAEELTKQIFAHSETLSAGPAVVPTKDEVDILGGSTEK